MRWSLVNTEKGSLALATRRAHWMALAIVVVADISVVEVRHLRLGHAGQCALSALVLCIASFRFLLVLLRRRPEWGKGSGLSGAATGGGDGGVVLGDFWR